MRQDYDVVIIGSGAAGGMAAHTLCKAGVRCLMLEAGPMVDMQRHRTMKAVYELLETATDRCEDAANVIESLVLENG